MPIATSRLKAIQAPDHWRSTANCVNLRTRSRDYQLAPTLEDGEMIRIFGSAPAALAAVMLFVSSTPDASAGSKPKEIVVVGSKKKIDSIAIKQKATKQKSGGGTGWDWRKQVQDGK
jgi:hypothetical protein